MADVRKQLAEKTTKLAKSSWGAASHPVLDEQFVEGSFVRIAIGLVQPDPEQPRKHFDESALEELAKSIKRNGVLQPVLIRRDQDKKIWLVAGERRLRAASTAGLDTIPAVLTSGNPAEIALIENIQRENLHPVDEAEALARLMAQHRYRQEDLARVIGKAQSTVAETLSLTRLPKVIKAEYRRADKFSRRLMIEVAKQKTPEKMQILFEKVKKLDLDGTAIRKLSRKKSGKKREKTVVEDVTRIISNSIKKLKQVNLDDLDENKKQFLMEEMTRFINELQQFIDFIKIPSPPDPAESS